MLDSNANVGQPAMPVEAYNDVANDYEGNKVPETLHEKQSTGRRNKISARPEINSGKALNEDIPVEKKPPRKGKSRKTRPIPSHVRYN